MSLTNVDLYFCILFFLIRESNAKNEDAPMLHDVARCCTMLQAKDFSSCGDWQAVCFCIRTRLNPRITKL